MDGMINAGMRRRLLLGAASAGALAALPPVARAQLPANRPVKVIVATSPGTGTDTISRLLAAKAQAKWNQPVIVENRPGASGVIGIESVAKAPPDGLTIMVQTSTMFLLPYFYKPIPFDVIRSFTPITQIGWSGFALVVNSGLPVNDYKEFLAWARSAPGTLSYGSPGAGTENHVFMEVLKKIEKLDLLHVPFKGAAGAMTDLMDGRIPTMFLPIQSAAGLARGGKVRMIATSMRERHPLFPQLPTLYEHGVRGMEFANWYGIWTPAGLPPALVEKFNADFGEIINSAELREEFARFGTVAKAGSAQDLGRMAEAQFREWGKLIEDTKIPTTPG